MFSALYKRWINLNLLGIAFYIFLFFLFALTDLISKDKFGIIFMLFGWVLIFIRFYIVQLIRDIKRINHIISFVEFEHQITIETFPVSILFGLINRNSIELTMPLNEIIVAETPENWPLLKRTMKSENNFAIIIAGEQFFLLRTLFEDSDIFDKRVGELLGNSLKS